MRIGYKWVTGPGKTPAIAKLEILGDVNEGPVSPFHLEYSPDYTKKRTSKVRVLEIYKMDRRADLLHHLVRPRKGKVFLGEARSPLANYIAGLTRLVYRPGQVKTVKNFDKSNLVCSTGIHFFDTVDEACKYASENVEVG